MQGTMKVFTPGELMTQTQIYEFDRPIQLEELQAAVGGYIEPVPRFTTIWDDDAKLYVECVAFCNEEGKLDELPVNPVATALWNEAVSGPSWRKPLADVLVGPVAIVFGDAEFMAEL